MTILWILLAALGLALVWTVLLFNRLVRRKNLTAEGFSGMDVQLKRRADLVPRLVEAVRGYAAHEKAVLEHVTAMRAQAAQAEDLARRARAEGELTLALQGLLAVAENYPQLKANDNFLTLQHQLTEIEDQIQMARRYYNGCVRNLNILVESFPGILVANLFRFGKAEFFQLDDASERKAPSASLETAP